MTNKNKRKPVRNALLTAFLIVPVTSPSFADQATPDVPSQQQEISTPEVKEPLLKHHAPQNVQAGDRLLIKTKIRGTDGVKLARVYFKTANADRYSFVVLNKGTRSVYSAEIPATGSAVSAVEYRIVMQSAFGEIHKSEKYYVPVVAASSNTVPQHDGFIDVFSEYPEEETQSDFIGFVDNVRFTYGTTKLVASTGSAAGGVAGAGSATTGTAATAAGAGAAATGLSTTALIAGGVVLAGGAAAASGGGSGGGGGASGDSVLSDNVTNQEGLEGGAGVIRANLEYQTAGYDLDLSLETPCGIIYYSQPILTCEGYTGTLDVDAGVGSNTDTVENIVFAEGAPSGTYTLRLDNLEPSPEPYTIRLFVGSDSTTFTGIIGADESLTIDQFSF